VDQKFRLLSASHRTAINVAGMLGAWIGLNVAAHREGGVGDPVDLGPKVRDSILKMLGAVFTRLFEFHGITTLAVVRNERLVGVVVVDVTRSQKTNGRAVVVGVFGVMSQH
jgi:hypothetical protein